MFNIYKMVENIETIGLFDELIYKSRFHGVNIQT